MYTIYKSPKIKMTDDSVICAGQIQAGDILLVEHVFGEGDVKTYPKIMKRLIATSIELYDTLRPRSYGNDGQWSENIMEYRKDAYTLLKLQKNCLRIGELYLLGRDISCFNSSPITNAVFINHQYIYEDLPITVNIISIIATKDIDVKNEICISLINDMNDINIDHVKSMITQYMEKDIYCDTIIRQLMIHAGLYELGTALVISNKFMKTYMKHFSKKPNLNDVEEWIKQVTDDTKKYLIMRK